MKPGLAEPSSHVQRVHQHKTPAECWISLALHQMAPKPHLQVSNGRFRLDTTNMLPGQKEAQVRAAESYKADLQAQIDDKKRRKVRALGNRPQRRQKLVGCSNFCDMLKKWVLAHTVYHAGIMVSRAMSPARDSATCPVSRARALQRSDCLQPSFVVSP